MVNPARAVALVMLLAVLPACSRKESGQPPDTSERKRFTPPDAAVAATVTGVVKFDGAVPKAQKIDMSQDSACGSQPNFDESIIVSSGGLANVFVYVKDGFNDVGFLPPPGPVTIAQKACRYEPHVAAAMVGQTVRFDNDDQTTHNVHMMPKQFRQWNESQMPGAAPIEKKFDRPEVMIPIQCNQHPWMHMYLTVTSAPFFAITPGNGRFEIGGLPPGTYTLAAVHEKLGEQDMKVTVGPKETKAVDFVFRSAE